MATQNKYIEYHIRLSKEENELLKKRAQAARMNPEKYFKFLICSEDFKLHRLELVTNDLNEHTALIYRLVKKIEGLIITINKSRKAYPQDIAKIESLLAEIRDENKRGYKVNSEERIKLYQDALEYLQKYIEN